MKRTVEIKVRLTEEEADALKELVKASGLSREAYIRSLINGYIPAILPGKEIAEYIHQLRKIGNNLNQIAYKANASGLLNEQEYYENYLELQRNIDHIMTYMNLPQKVR